MRKLAFFGGRGDPLSPAVGFGIEIVMIQKAENVSDQGCNAAKAARADDLAGDFAKEAFHQIEPGGRGGNEMDVKTGMTLKPSGGLWRACAWNSCRKGWLQSRRGLEGNASGAKQERAERKKVLALAQARKVDVILVTELTRWGRSARFAARSLTCFKFRFVSSPPDAAAVRCSARFGCPFSSTT